MNIFTGAVPRPIRRGRFRQVLGREYFIFRRKIQWWFGRERMATLSAVSLPHAMICHRSILLRQLPHVEMLLQRNKVTNLRLAIARINGAVIEPGETFSVWRMVGRPTRARGYLEGLVLNNGTIARGVGGGLCQLGNLLYWMALHTPLTVTERWRHGYDVFPDVNRTVPFACGATLAYNYIDLKLTNKTRARYQINLWLDDTHLNGEIRSNTEPVHDYEVFETDHQIRTQWWGGYTRHNRIWKRVISRVDQTHTQDLVAENHAIMMYNPMLPEGGERVPGDHG